VQRRNRPEMMDQLVVEEAELAEDLRNLGWFNRFLGNIAVLRAHLPLRNGEWSVVSGESTGSQPVLAPLPWTVLDVATGGGDVPRWLVRRYEERVSLLAADLHPTMLRIARGWSAGLPVRFLRCDARRLPFRDHSMDLVLCSQMLHHLTEADAVAVLRELGRVAGRRLIVNDLRRSRIAYFLIWLITRFFRNRLSRYDGHVSIERSFTPAELEALAREAGLDRRGRFRLYRHRFYRMALVFEPVP